MFEKFSFDNNIFMKIIQWIYELLMMNLVFWLINIPLFVAGSLLAIDVANVVLFSLAMTPFGVGIIGLFWVMRAIAEKKGGQPVRISLLGIKRVGMRGLQYGLLAWGLSVVAVVDIYFFYVSAGVLIKYLIPFFLLLMVWGISICLNCCYLQVGNPEHSKGDIMKTAVYYSLSKWYASLINSILFLIIPVLMIIKPQFGFTLAPSVLLGLIFLNCRFSMRGLGQREEQGNDL